MEKLEINTIPNFLLARILLQLHTLPPKEIPGFVDIIAAGLQRYGSTCNINAFLNYCSSLSQLDRPWLWEYYEINNERDWQLANHKKPQELVGLRFLLASETARKSVQLTRFGRNVLLDPKCCHIVQDHILPVDQILNDTLDYLKQEQSDSNKLVEELIELRLEQYTRDKFTFQQESKELDDTNYHFMGALMAKYDYSASNGNAPDCWCLYLRDYVESDGSGWRVINTDKESMISSEQALADIRGTMYESFAPSEFSKHYRPIYLFYVNQDMLIVDSQKEQHITLEDYTFDEEYEYPQENPIVEEQQEEDTCKHCGLEDTIDINDIFFCENCDQGVHQLCEVPPIQAFEKNIDPWYCRECCQTLNIALPTCSSSAAATSTTTPPPTAAPPSTTTPPPTTAPPSTTTEALPSILQTPTIPIKRKRELQDQDKIK